MSCTSCEKQYHLVGAVGLTVSTRCLGAIIDGDKQKGGHGESQAYQKFLRQWLPAIAVWLS